MVETMRSLVVCLGFLAVSIACGAIEVLAGKKADGGPTDFCLVSVETVDAAGKHRHPALPVSAPVGVDGGSQPSGDGDLPVLSRIVVNLPLTPIKASELAVLCRTQNIPVNFILAGTETPVLFPIRTGKLKEILELLVRRDRHYAYAVICDRLVLYPHGPKYETRITIPTEQFSGLPRLEAATNYVLWLRANVSWF